MIKVYHNSDFVDFFFTRSFEKSTFTHVADVDTNDLNVAYEKTNHWERSWQENAEVTPKNEKARSTSVGDVLVVEGPVVYVVASIGFQLLTSEQLATFKEKTK